MFFTGFRCFCHPLVEADFSFYPNTLLHRVGTTTSIGVSNKSSWFSTTKKTHISKHTLYLIFFGHHRCFQQMFFLLLLQALLEQLSSFQQPDVLSFHSMAMALELDQRHSVIENGLQAVFFWEFVWSLMMLKIYPPGN